MRDKKRKRGRFFFFFFFFEYRKEKEKKERAERGEHTRVIVCRWNNVRELYTNIRQRKRDKERLKKMN